MGKELENTQTSHIISLMGYKPVTYEVTTLTSDPLSSPRQCMLAMLSVVKNIQDQSGWSGKERERRMHL